MVDADDFVSGSSVRWRDLATTLVGSAVLAVVAGFSEAMQTLIGGIVGLGESGLLAIAGLWSESVEIVLRGYNAAVASFESGAALLGPFAVPVAFVSVVGMLLISREVVARVGV